MPPLRSKCHVQIMTRNSSLGSKCTYAYIRVFSVLTRQIVMFFPKLSSCFHTEGSCYLILPIGGSSIVNAHGWIRWCTTEYTKSIRYL